MEILSHFRKVARRVTVVCLLTTVCWAAEPALEYQVKAAFLLNFARFVEWPETTYPSPEAPFSICVLGEDPFGTALSQTVEDESVNGRKIAVRQIRRPSTAEACQILFVSKSEKFSGAEFGPGILTVGEADGFLTHGGIIAFVIEDRKVRFDIGRNAAAKAGLKLSSKLLRVARSLEK